MAYIDGFVLPVSDVDAYKKMAKLGGKVWMDHGALQYIEALADDVPEGKTTDFYRAVKRKEGETVVLAFVVYKSRAHRDRVMKKVMADPRSHLLIETAAARTPLRRAGGLELDIGLGVSTPVVLRAGPGNARARIGATRLLRDADGLLELSTKLHPAGEFSAYGQIVVRLTPAGGQPIELSRLDNIAAWSETTEKHVSVPLNAQYLPPGMLEISYTGRSEYEGRVFARRVFEVEPPN